jgi:hypothetical protein
MRIDAYEFGRITIDGVVYDHDVVIEALRVDLLIKPTPELVRLFNESPPLATNLILHVAC